MTEDEAKKISRVLGTADGGCPYCVESLERLMNHYFPDFVWGEGQKPDESDVRDCERAGEAVKARQAQAETEGEP